MKKIEDINKYIKFFHENKNVKYKNELSIKSDNKLNYNYRNSIRTKDINIFNIYLMLFILFIPIIKPKEIKQRFLNFESIIFLRINTKGSRYILNKDFKSLPTKVYINSVEEPEIKENNYYAIPTKKCNVTIIYDYQLTDCSKMFSGLKNILTLNLSRFDTSLVTDMNNMFSGCNIMTHLDLSNLNTAKVKDMNTMFKNCAKLKTLNLGSFITSEVTDMSSMFHSCTSLLSINLNSFDTSKVKKMANMFYSCSSLISLNLNHFDTLSVDDYNNMFYQVTKLKYCLNSSNTKFSAQMKNKLDIESSFENTCDDDCFQSENDNKLISKSNQCVDNCTNTKYQFEYYYICDNKCPKDTHNSYDDYYLCEDDLICDIYYNTNHTKCLWEIEEGYYLNESHSQTIYKCEDKCKTCSYKSTKNDLCILCNNDAGYYQKEDDESNIDPFIGCYKGRQEKYYFDGLNKIYKKCYNTCKDCEGPGDDNNNGCTECITNYTLIDNNCYEKCENYFYIDSSGQHCVDECPYEYKYIIEEEKKCIDNCNNNNIYKIEYNNKCYKTCPLNTYYNYEQTGCIDIIPEGFYLNDTENNTIDKCDIKCKTCTLDSVNNNLCTSCNNEKGYYQKEDDTLNNNIMECLSGEEEGYYFEETNKIYKKCYKTCKFCEGVGDENNNKCKECISNYLKLNNNCYENCNDYNYIDSSGYHCVKTCPDNYKYTIVEEKKCIDNCINDNIYKLEYNNKCYKTCPLNTYYNYEQTGCIDIIPEGFYLNDTENNTIDKCDIKCKTCTLDSVNNNLCTSCNNEKGYYQKEDDISINNFDCLNSEPMGYYFDELNSIYKRCYKSCKKCSDKGDVENQKCSECYLNSTLNGTNCYEKCDFYYYFDKTKEYHCTQIDQCPNEYNKLIREKKQCIDNCYNDNIYIFEYNNTCYQNIQIEKTYIKEVDTEVIKTIYTIDTMTHNEYDCPENYLFLDRITGECLKDCSAINFFYNICGIRNNNNHAKDIMIKNIEDEIIDGSLDILLNDLLNEDINNIIMEDNDVSYQIILSNNKNNQSSQINQITNNKNNKISNINNNNIIFNYDNLSMVFLEECEDILKEKYNINKNISLIIFKVDYHKEDFSIPFVGYEIFNPMNKSKLDLNYCKNTTINENLPAYIDENNLFKYDPTSEYYNDECFPFTTDKGTDILIKDRQEEYNNNKMILCENTCKLKGYISNSKKSICECIVKEEQIKIEEIAKQTNTLSYNFLNTDESTSSISFKCNKLLFSSKGLSKNISSYILIFIIIFFILSGALFYKFGYLLLEEYIKNILISKGEEIENILKVKFQKKNKRSIKNIKKELVIKDNADLSNNSTNHKSISKLEIRSIQVYNNIRNNNNKYEIQKTVSNDNSPTDYELNNLSYEEARETDKRKYYIYYLSLIKTKHPIIFSFFPIKDYNTLLIKMDLFFLSFSIYYFVNSLFFDKLTIHKIYKDEGKFNCSYLILYAFFSFLISHFLCTIIKFFSLSEKNICEIKKQINLEKAKAKALKAKKVFKILYICFYAISDIYLLFCWYFLSSFGALYQNTQKYLIINTIISFGFCLIYPFFINLIPTLLRNYSLREPNRVTIYEISKIIQIL